MRAKVALPCSLEAQTRKRKYLLRSRALSILGGSRVVKILKLYCDLRRRKSREHVVSLGCMIPIETEADHGIKIN